eukprot:6398749-Prorocentrum_lima.AAC.1
MRSFQACPTRRSGPSSWPGLWPSAPPWSSATKSSAPTTKQHYRESPRPQRCVGGEVEGPQLR